jgi:hypothetical protein
MGWSEGSEIAKDVWSTFRKYVPKKDRKKLARKLIKFVEDRDCDTIEECTTLCKDAEIFEECRDCGEYYRADEYDPCSVGRS